jgi:hypothetical protein
MTEEKRTELAHDAFTSGSSDIMILRPRNSNMGTRDSNWFAA